MELSDSERKCVGCGKHDAREGLERFVKMEDNVIFDMRKKAPGRGAHVHATTECLNRAIKSGFAKSFKAKVKIEDDFLNIFLSSVFTRFQEGLRVAFRNSDLVFGGDLVSEAMKNNRVRSLVIASDAGHAVSRKFESNAQRKETPYFTAIRGAILGGILGKDFISVLGFVSRRATPVYRDLQILEKMGFWNSDLNPKPNKGIGIANGEEQILEEIVGRKNDRT